MSNTQLLLNVADDLRKTWRYQCPICEVEVHYGLNEQPGNEYQITASCGCTPPVRVRFIQYEFEDARDPWSHATNVIMEAVLNARHRAIAVDKLSANGFAEHMRRKRESR